MCCIFGPLILDDWKRYEMDPIYQQLSKVYTWKISDEAVCLAVLFFHVLPRHTNIMADKGFNGFDACASRCVHLSPQEEECALSSWGDSKMYTSSSIARWQRMLTTPSPSAPVKCARWVLWLIKLLNLSPLSKIMPPQPINN